MEEINYKDEYEILKAKYSILENKYNIDVANLKRERDKSDDDYDIVVDKFNELADKFNLKITKMTSGTKICLESQ